MSKTRALLLILLIVLGLFVAGAVAVPLLTREDRETTSLNGAVRTVRIDSERGSVALRTGGTSGATVEARTKWILVGPEVRTDLSDGVLTVDVHCPALSIASCSANLVVTVPENVDADLKTVRGLLTVQGVRGAVKAVSEDGDVRVDTPSRDISAGSVTGAVGIRTPVVPLRIAARSETHDVVVRVPPGGYRLAVSSGVGTVTVQGVSDDRTSARQITAGSGAGDVRVVGEAPAGG